MSIKLSAKADPNNPHIQSLVNHEIIEGGVNA